MTNDRMQNFLNRFSQISLNQWILFIFICLLPISIFRDFTPANELRYISIADEALRNGHWFMLTNNGEPYSDKPPFYFWFIMLAKLITGEYRMWLLMLFSLVPSLGIVYTMNKWCRNELGENYGGMAPLLLMTTGFYAGTAMVLRMDMLMVWFIVLALYSFYKMYKGIGSFGRNQIMFGVYILLGFYSKAFMGILIPLLTSLVFLISKKEGKSFFKYWNWKVWSIVVGGILAWFAMVWVEAGTEYLYNLTVGQTVSRSVKVTVHKYPFYYYLVFLSYAVAPWTLMYVGNIIWGVKKKILTSDLQRLFLIEIVSTFIMLSCFGSKLAVYLVPIFPFMTYLSLMALEKMEWNKWEAMSVSISGVAVIGAFPAYLVASRMMSQYAGFLLLLCSVLLTVTGVVSLLAAWKYKNIRYAVQTFCVGFLVTAFLGGFVVPQFNSEIGYGELGKLANKYEKEWNTEGVTTLGVWRAQNMNVYFPDRLKVYGKSQTDSLKHIHNQLLIINSKYKNKEGITDILENQQHEEVINGKYIFVKIP